HVCGYRRWARHPIACRCHGPTLSICRRRPGFAPPRLDHHGMSSFDTLLQDLVIANRILAKEDVVDAYGHVSVRHPDNPKHFFISRSLAPELIEKTDIVELGLDGQPVRDEKRSLYLERFIHAAIYEKRPEVTAVVHA